MTHSAFPHHIYTINYDLSTLILLSYDLLITHKSIIYFDANPIQTLNFKSDLQNYELHFILAEPTFLRTEHHIPQLHPEIDARFLKTSHLRRSAQDRTRRLLLPRSPATKPQERHDTASHAACRRCRLRHWPPPRRAGFSLLCSSPPAAPCSGLHRSGTPPMFLDAGGPRLRPTLLQVPRWC
jgi:hypothetical protein